MKEYNMEFRLLDENYKDILQLDIFTSIVWTERYASSGDFLLEMPASRELVETMTNGRYILSNQSTTVMVIEERNVINTFEDGEVLMVSGRSMEEIIGRRIIWKMTQIDSGFETAVKKLLDENVLKPTDTKRKLSMISWLPSGDPDIDKVKLKFQITGENVLEMIKTLCEQYGFGFKLIFDGLNGFKFQLYNGKDRTQNQFVNPYVIFSPDFDNLGASNYLDSAIMYRNVALVAGEDLEVGGIRRTQTVGSASGINRYELFVDARDIQSETPDGTYTDEDYNELLKSRGEQKLEPYGKDVAVTGAVEDGGTFQYGRDYYLGDIVQLVTEQRVDLEVRVTELVYTRSASSESRIPTFVLLDEEEEE